MGHRGPDTTKPMEEVSWNTAGNSPLQVLSWNVAGWARKLSNPEFGIFLASYELILLQES